MKKGLLNMILAISAMIWTFSNSNYAYANVDNVSILEASSSNDTLDFYSDNLSFKTEYISGFSVISKKFTLSRDAIVKIIISGYGSDGMKNVSSYIIEDTTNKRMDLNLYDKASYNEDSTLNAGVYTMYIENSSSETKKIDYSITIVSYASSIIKQLPDSGKALENINGSSETIPAMAIMYRDFTLEEDKIINMGAKGIDEKSVALLNRDTNKLIAIGKDSTIFLIKGSYSLCIVNNTGSDIGVNYFINIIPFSRAAKELVFYDYLPELDVYPGEEYTFSIYDKSGYIDMNNIRVESSDANIVNCSIKSKGELYVTLSAIKSGECEIHILYHDTIIKYVKVTVKKSFEINKEILDSYKTFSTEINGKAVAGYELDSGSAINLEFTYNGKKLNPKKIGTIIGNENTGTVKVKNKGYSFEASQEGSSVINFTYEGENITLCLKVNNVKFSLKEENKTLRYGDTAKIEFLSNSEIYFGDPKQIIFSDKKVIDYDDEYFTITAKKSGTCIITFTMANGQKLKYTVSVPKFTMSENLLSQNAYASESGSTYSDKNGTYAYVSLYNRGKKVITYVEFSVFQYENRGIRINKNNSDFIYDYNITKNASTNIYVPFNTRKYRVCIKRVYYSDDSIWENPFYDDWVKKYSSKY